MSKKEVCRYLSLEINSNEGIETIVHSHTGELINVEVDFGALLNTLESIKAEVKYLLFSRNTNEITTAMRFKSTRSVDRLKYLIPFECLNFNPDRVKGYMNSFKEFHVNPHPPSQGKETPYILRKSSNEIRSERRRKIAIEKKIDLDSQIQRINPSILLSPLEKEMLGDAISEPTPEEILLASKIKKKINHYLPKDLK